MGTFTLGKCCKFTGLDTACTAHGSSAGMFDGLTCGQTGDIPYPTCQVAALGCCNGGFSPKASAALPPAQNATAPALALGFARTAQAQSSLGDGAVSVNIKPLPFIGFL